MATDIADRFEALLFGGDADVNAFYRDARNDAPIFWSDAFNGWVVSKYDDAYRVLHDEEHFGPLSGGGGSTVIHGRTILHMEGVEHRRKSAILAKYLRSKPLLEGPQRDYVLELGAELLDAIGSEEVCDLRQAFAMPLPLRVTAWIMGIQEAPNFRQMYDEIAAGGGQNMSGDAEVHALAVAARERLTDFVTPLIIERRANPGDDLLSVLCSTEYEGERLSDDEIRSFCSFLLAAGIETTDRGLSSLLKKLFSDPELWERLRSDRSLVPSAVAESIRWAPPVCALARGVLEATELQGQKLEAGEKIVMLLASANRDDDHWDQPEIYVIDRFAGNEEAQYGARAKVLSFGHGRHLCTGSLLARLEMIEGLHLLLDRFEGADFADGVPPEQGFVFRSPEHLRVCPHTAGAGQ
jgi:cytochrome P450